MEQFVANISGKVRRVNEGGKSWLVAPSTLIVPGVLAGSKGPLLYKPEDIRRSAPAWNGMPLVIYHPHDPITNQPLSAQDPEHGPGVIEKQGVGEVRKSRFGKKHQAESWFDEEKLKRVSPVTHKRLLAGDPVELSTGLFTDNIEQTGSFNGKPYTAVATNFRPDHLAVLPDQLGACSIKDGCGILVNKKQTFVINPAWVEDHDIWEKAKAAADKGDYDDDSYYAVVTSIYKKMGGSIAPTKNSASEATMNKLQQLVGNSNPEGHNQYTGGRGWIPDPNDPETKLVNLVTASPEYQKHYKDYLKDVDKPNKKDIGEAKSYAMRHPETKAVIARHKKELGITDNSLSTKLQQLVGNAFCAKIQLLANSNPEGINQYSKGGSAHDEKGKFTNGNGGAKGGKGSGKVHGAAKSGLNDVDHSGPDRSGDSNDGTPQSERRAQAEEVGKNLAAESLAGRADTASEKASKIEYDAQEGVRSKQDAIDAHQSAADKHGAASDGWKNSKAPNKGERSLYHTETKHQHLRDVKRLQGTNNMSSNLQDKLTALLNSSVENADVKEGTSVVGLAGSGTPKEDDLAAQVVAAGVVASPMACPACGKLKVSRDDEAEEVNEDTFNCDEKMTKNQSTDVVDNDNQVQQEGGPTMATVTLNAEEREAVVNGLIGGECCFEENEREVLNSLSDRTLARLTLNAKPIPKFIQDKIDAKAAKEEEETEEPEVEEEEEVENVDDQATDEDDRAGLGPRAGKGTGKNESQAMGKVKPMGDLNPKATNNQLSAEDRQFLAIGRKVIADRRGMLINTITANSRNPFDKKELAVMNLDQLEKLGQLAAVENEVKQPAFTLNRFASYMGSAAGVGMVGGDDGTDDDVLPLPVMNWKEPAKV